MRILTCNFSRQRHKLQHSVKNDNFACELCDKLCSDQFEFFEHLKNHYEPATNGNDSDEIPQLLDAHTLADVDDTVSIKDMECSSGSGDHQINKTNDNKYVNEETSYLKCGKCGQLFISEGTYECHVSISHPNQEVIEEFSEPEDMMEGIRGVVNMVPMGNEEDRSFDFWNFEKNAESASIQLQVEESDSSTCSFSMRRTLSTIEENEMKEGEAETIPDDASVLRKARKEMQCSHCGRKFVHRNSLLYHIHSHAGHRPHQCKECGKSFFVVGALKIHQRLHSGDKPYKCEYCGRSFRQWGDLKYHFTSLHSNTKMFQCEYCGKDFARKYSLVVHRRIHTGEKNYRCEYCMKTFRAASYLQNHRRIHTGEKPHTCTICGKPFRVRSDMKRHMKTHRGPESVNVLNNVSNNVADSNSSDVKQIYIVNNDQINDEKQVMRKTAIVNLQTIQNMKPTISELNVRQDTQEGVFNNEQDDILNRENSGTLYVWIQTNQEEILPNT